MNLSEQECPECKQDYNGLSIESSSEMLVSIISCSECGFHFSDECCEEGLIDKFKSKYKDTVVQEQDMDYVRVGGTKIVEDDLL